MNKKPSKKKKWKIVVVVLIILCVLAAIPFYIITSKLGRINTTKITENSSELKIDENKFNTPDKNENDFINVLLLGIDSRDTSTDPGRSDSMIIATIDKKHSKIKLTSLMRDTLVDMTGHGPMEGLNQDRLNHTYAYGGALLTMQTINQNFDMNLKNYVKVDFWGLEKIIDSIGGVNIDVKQDEIQYINAYMTETAKIKKESIITVKKAGMQKLNGSQAVAYSRIRYIGTDYERTERQRKVLSEVFKNISQKNTLELYKAVDTILPYVETSFTKTELLGLASSVALNKITTVEQYRIPEDKLGFTTYVNKQYFIGWKKDETITNLHKFIFETDK
ncbi:cell envelope-like function transcriptional attenuator common domain protein [Clostridiales bacterium oral taxon 876 str. F0540]|nr:cell envelope-like function transcriptional attenuator common domain protein [Clostridiales bacterium oral taxon 876 str. F0540]